MVMLIIVDLLSAWIGGRVELLEDGDNRAVYRIQLTEPKWRGKRKKKGGIAKDKGVATEPVNFVYFC